MTDLQLVRFKLADNEKNAIDTALADGDTNVVELSRRPVSNLQVFLNEVVTNDYISDNSKGIVTFNNTPAMGTNIAVHYTYTVFSDDEITASLTRTGSVSKTMVELIEVLLADSSRRFDYSSGESEVKASQVFDNLFNLLKYWKDQAQSEANANDGGGVRIATRTNKHLNPPKRDIEKDLSRLR